MESHQDHNAPCLPLPPPPPPKKRQFLLRGITVVPREIVMGGEGGKQGALWPW